MSNENTETAVTPVNRILVHTRSKEDCEILKEQFNISKHGNPTYVYGLGMNTQKQLMLATIKGEKIFTSGLPLDISAECGELTVVRAWKTEKTDGTKSSGSVPPVNYYVGKIVNAEAYAKLKLDPNFLEAFTSTESEEEEDGAAF